ncbi:MAG: DedA family protein [Deltaproteobacteria bacterium]|nr:MAG: DedA family protein [Deltaproteobacteria bacterium]
MPRRLYNWVLSWAETPYGPLALFVLSFAESSFFPIPPDPLLMALCLGAISKSFRFAALCTIASVLGGVFGYYLGYAAYEAIAQPILELYGKVDTYEEVAGKFRDQGDLAVLVAAITPIPYKVVTITAGATQMSLGPFIGASLVGRGLRFFAVAGLLWWKGEPIAAFIEKYFEILAMVFGVLLVGGFAVLKWMH